MNHCKGRTRGSWVTRMAAVAGACVVSLQPAPHAHATTLPKIPMEIEVPSGNRLFRVEHAIGTQNYMCLPSSLHPPVEWTLLGPQATLFNTHDRQTMTHFQSPNADEGGTMRPTWQDSRDSSAVWGKKKRESSDPAFVDPDAIPWLLVEVVGRDVGPTGRHAVSYATYLQRLNTSGGQAPATGCVDATNIGARVQVPYSADYFFFRSIGPLE